MVDANSSLLRDDVSSKSSELRTRPSSGVQAAAGASLLEADANAVSGPASEEAPSADSPRSGWPAPPWLAGSDVSRRYRIDGVLGTGGMGIVYAATHLELDLPVALKVMRADLAAFAEARARFCTEARASAALRSQHILRVLDAGGLGSAQCYVVTERLEGNNLAEIVQTRGPLPVTLAVDYVLQAAAGLAEAHDLGLIHRDIKPENLFLAKRPNEAPIIKVMDFGIARWLAETHAPRLTHPRANLGSPCYQSPEQMADVLHADARSDIWSLGLVLFELLTGTCPFEGDTIQETCWKVLKGPRPSLSRERSGIPPGLAAVVARCLEADPNRRWPSMRKLAEALAPYALNTDASRPIPLLQPVSTPRPSHSHREPPEKSREKVSRPRVWGAVAAYALGAATAVGVLEARELDLEQVRHVVSNGSSRMLTQADALLRQVLQSAQRLAAPTQ